MKRKYNTLNEEVNRMKSLFGESRLYGNLVSNEKTNLITEAGPGKRFFARNLAKAFNVTLKSFEDLGQLTKFLNREINSVDDMIKHVDDFPGIWKAVASETDMGAVRRNLVKLKKVDESNLLKGLSKEDALDIINGFPSEGGMQDMIKDMWLKANNKNTLLPSVKDTRIAVIDPKTKQLVIGKQNTETGVVVGINKNGEMVTVEKPKGEWKKGDDLDMERTDIKGEFIDYIEVPKGTTLDDLNNKSVLGTEENMKRVEEAAYKKGKEEAAKGNQTVYNIKVGDNANVNMGTGTINSKSIDELAKDVVENTETPKDIPVEEIGNWRKKLLKITTNGLKKLGGGTRYWWNFHTLNLPFLPKFETFKTNKEQIGAAVFRTFVLLPVTYESIRIATSDDKYFAKDWENNFFTATFEDLTRKAANIDYEGPMKMYNKMFGTLTTNLSKGKVNTTVVKNDIEQAVKNEIIYAGKTTVDKDGKRLSTLTCIKLLNFNSDAEVLEHVLNKHKDNAISKSLKILMSTYGEATEKLISAEGNLKEYVDLLLNVIKGDSDTLDLVKLQRLNCKNSQKENKEIEFRMSDEYKCTIHADSTGGAK
jgi:hypothetical protein